MRAAAEPLLSCNIPKYIYMYITNIYTPSISNIYIPTIYTPNISQYVQIDWCCFCLISWALLPSHYCRATFPNTYKSISQGYIPQIDMNIYLTYIWNIYPKYIHPRLLQCVQTNRVLLPAMTVVQYSQIHVNMYLKNTYPKYIPSIYPKYMYPRYISICANEWSASAKPLLSCNIPKYIYMYISQIYIPQIYPKNISQINTSQTYFAQTNGALLPSHFCRATFPNTYKCISQIFIPQTYPKYMSQIYIPQIHLPNICTPNVFKHGC